MCEDMRRGLGLWRRQASAALGWVGVLMGLLGGTGSARAGDEAARPPFEAMYVPDQTSGTIVLHAAAIAQRLGKVPAIAAEIKDLDLDLGILTGTANEPANPDRARLRLEIAGIETFVASFELTTTALPAGADGKPDKLFTSFKTGGFTIRTVAPYDWHALLAALPFSLRTVQDGDRTYHTIVVPRQFCPAGTVADVPFAVFLPDDRTMVVESASFINTLIHRTVPVVPAYLRGDDWARVSRGLVAVALDNTGDALLRGYDPTIPELGEITLLVERLKGVERLLIGVDADPAGSLTLQVAGTARDEALARSLAASVGLYALLGRAGAGKEPANDGISRLLSRFCRGAQVQATDRTVRLSVPDCLTTADLTALLATVPARLDPAVQPARLDAVPPAPPARIDPNSVRLLQVPEPPPRLAIPPGP